MKFVILVALLSFLNCANTLTLITHLNEKDVSELRKVFETAVTENDLSSIFFGLAGQKLLSDKVTDSNKACERALKLVNEEDVESLFYAAGIVEALGTSCKIQLNKAQTTITAALESNSAVSLYYAAIAAKIFQIKIDTKKFSDVLIAISKKDNSASNLSYIFNAASAVLDEQGVAQFMPRIEECIAQADELDNKYLLFEGGLTPTALAVTGIYGVAHKAKKVPSVKADQVLKLTNFLLSRKGVKLARPAYYFLQALHILARNQFFLPVVFTRVNNVAISSKNPAFKVRITDVLGRPIDGLTVLADANPENTPKTATFTKKSLKFDPTSKLYELNFLETKSNPGFYRLTISANSADPRLIGQSGAQFTVKVVTEITVEEAQLAVIDKDQVMSSSNAQKLPSFSKLSTILDADSHQKLSMKFKIKDKTTNAATTIHQTFVVFGLATSKREIAFVAESDSSKVYSFDVDFSKAMKDFDFQSGKYTVKLVLGDPLVANSIEWIVADINLKFPVREKQTESGVEHICYEKKPEITHMFRQAEKRPSSFLSDIFTGLVLLPLLILLIIWFRLGANLSNFSFDLYTLGFHAGLAGIFGLYFVFWLQLNMFQTLKYLAAIACFTFVTGNKMLRHMADKRKLKTE